tara:strand:+ start:5862 stop:6044 length:183 start_codon:yes stop_codon:yes gene_type:complete
MMLWIIAFLAVLLLFLITAYRDQRYTKGRGWFVSSFIAITFSSFATSFLVGGAFMLTTFF